MILKVAKANKISGEVIISGSKNSSLPIICAALIVKGKVELKNIPNILDVQKLIVIIKSLGIKIQYNPELNILLLQTKKNKKIVDHPYTKDIRASYYLISSILTRNSKLTILKPGGCKLGTRPINYHIHILEKFGFRVTEDDKYLYVKEIKRHPAHINLPRKSVGATINAIILSTSIKGITTINNASLEPEVIDVINFLNKLGCDIKIEHNKIYIYGKNKNCKIKSTTYTIMPDRIEAGSYLFLAASIPNSMLKITNVNLLHMESILVVARALKIKIEVLSDKNSIIVKAPDKKNNNGINLLISEYPAFPTDLQQIISVFLLTRNKSIIEDKVFPERISHIKELNKLKANIEYKNQTIVVKKSELVGNVVEAKDLRCAMCLVVAGGIAKGVTIIKGAEYLLRGYEKPISKLRAIGFKINKE